MEFALVNPRKRGGKKKRTRRGKTARRRTVSARRASRRSSVRTVRVYKRTTRRVSRAARRRNPITLTGLKSRVMPALLGGGGAVLTEAAFRLIPLPAMLKGNLVAPVTKAALAVGVAKVASMILGAKRGDDMLNGALAVIGFGLVNDMVLRFMPTVGGPVNGDYDFAGLGYGSPGAAVRGTGYLPAPGSGVNEYIGAMGGLGEYVSGGDYDFA